MSQHATATFEIDSCPEVGFTTSLEPRTIDGEEERLSDLYERLERNV